MTNRYSSCILTIAFASPCASDPSLAFSFRRAANASAPPALPPSQNFSLCLSTSAQRAGNATQTALRNLASLVPSSFFISFIPKHFLTLPKRGFPLISINPNHLYALCRKTPGWACPRPVSPFTASSGSATCQHPQPSSLHALADTSVTTEYGCPHSRYPLFTALPTGFAVMTSTYVLPSIVPLVHSRLRVPVAILVASR